MHFKKTVLNRKPRIVNSVFVLSLLLLSQSMFLSGHEGMWIPMLLEKYGEMTEEGLMLSKEDIYSINQACLKDAVVIFNNGCTGELVSAKGLLLTNHHCGFSAIQQHSSVEHDYLTDGFWAYSMEEELPNPGMKVTFLRYIEDVTAKVLDGTDAISNPEKKEQRIKLNIQKLELETADATGLVVDIESLFYGSSFFMFVYENYTDIRVVGAPPSSIGNFGEDNDNWIWPRHTGDFSMFRIYADSENKPADYSPANVPYKPRKYLSVSLKGVEEGDYTMVMGYPGSTEQFLISDAIRNMLDISLPEKVKLRTRRLDIMGAYMNGSDEVRIQYASKYRGVSNAWKKWQGIIMGLDRVGALQAKEEQEAAFMEWAAADPERLSQYGKLIPQMKEIYGKLAEIQLVYDYLREAVMAPELPVFATRLFSAMEKNSSAENIRNMGDGVYKDLYLPIEMEVFSAMMKYYYDDIAAVYYPAFMQKMKSGSEEEFKAYTDKLYKRSLLSTKEGFARLISVYEQAPGKAIKMLYKDPLFTFLNDFYGLYQEDIFGAYNVLNKSLNPLYRDYVIGLREMQKDRVFYPDANFTMRVTFGKVEGYQPQDAVSYTYATTLGGIIQKSKEGQKDYLIPGKLLDLYEQKDFGSYGVNGTMPVCFVASNHTSGGNSGSPVLNGKGELIGINFDRNWEGTMSDIMYDPSICRNISVDIRYVLFIIEKFAGAGYLIEEMDLVF